MNRLTATLVCMCAACLTASLLCGCGSTGGNDHVSLWLINRDQFADALWVGYQDGASTRAWTTLTPNAYGTYSFMPKDPTRQYGLTVVTTEGGRPRVRIIHATLDDGSWWTLPGSDAAGCSIICHPVDVSAGGSWSASMFSGSSRADWCDPICLESIPAGKRDLVAAYFTKPTDQLASRLVVQREHPVAAGDRMDIDFNGPYAFESATYPISARSSAGATIGVCLHTGHGASLQTSNLVGSGHYAALPVNGRDPSDVYVAVAEVSSATSVRQGISAFKTPAAEALDLPGSFGQTTVARADSAGPQLRMRATWTPFENARAYQLTYATGTANTNRERSASDQKEWTVVVSPRWLAANQRVPASLEYVLPDLHQATGWNAAWNLNGRYPVAWTIGACLSGDGMATAVSLTYPWMLWDGVRGQFSGTRGTSAVNGE